MTVIFFKALPVETGTETRRGPGSNRKRPQTDDSFQASVLAQLIPLFHREAAALNHPNGCPVDA